MAHARIDLVDGRVRLARAGRPKFVDHVDEVTFSGRQALANGKQVWCVTHVGVFRLTDRGMELCRVMPGVHVRPDVLEACPMRVVLPDGDVPVVDASIVAGRGFRLEWGRPA